MARIALATGAPVIPVAMIGSDLAQPIGQVVPSTRHRVGIVVGEPLDFLNSLNSMPWVRHLTRSTR